MKKKWDIGNLNLGKPLSKEIRDKISKKKKYLVEKGLITMPIKSGDKLTKEQKDKISAGRKGIHPWNYHQTLTDKHKAALSKAAQLREKKNKQAKETGEIKPGKKQAGFRGNQAV